VIPNIQMMIEEEHVVNGGNVDGDEAKEAQDATAALDALAKQQEAERQLREQLDALRQQLLDSQAEVDRLNRAPQAAVPKVQLDIGSLANLFARPEVKSTHNYRQRAPWENMAPFTAYSSCREMFSKALKFERGVRNHQEIMTGLVHLSAATPPITRILHAAEEKNSKLQQNMEALIAAVRNGDSAPILQMHAVALVDFTAQEKIDLLAKKDSAPILSAVLQRSRYTMYRQMLLDVHHVDVRQGVTRVSQELRMEAESIRLTLGSNAAYVKYGAQLHEILDLWNFVRSFTYPDYGRDVFPNGTPEDWYALNVPLDTFSEGIRDIFVRTVNMNDAAMASHLMSTITVGTSTGSAVHLPSLIATTKEYTRKTSGLSTAGQTPDTGTAAFAGDRKVCTFHQAGRCQYGDKCYNDHGDASKSDDKGSRKGGSSESKNSSDSDTGDGERCLNFIKGKCRFGGKCRRIHDKAIQDAFKSAKRRRDSVPGGGGDSSRPPCHQWQKKGKCSYKKKCRFSHSDEHRSDGEQDEDAREPKSARKGSSKRSAEDEERYARADKAMAFLATFKVPTGTPSQTAQVPFYSGNYGYGMYSQPNQYQQQFPALMPPVQPNWNANASATEAAARAAAFAPANGAGGAVQGGDASSSSSASPN
jgi:hypothetical protein